MGKVFTITVGLENLGAIRTGGQGSVYKAKRTGEIITAVKLLPTPIHTEDENDKNYRDFISEVEKLKKVNEHPNPNVVKILSSGLTESGSFPYIEMEYIEGPDLQELLEPPREPLFTVTEIIKLADQLSNALSHCHMLGIRHGDIKSNNVKFNIHSGNYVLLDFGLAIMSDEQRRTSLRHAGAVEFMAPEQNEGHMLFQSDVYSFGVIIYELIAGQVPFPLNSKGETERNKVMLAHTESDVPDVLELRKANLPESWTDQRKMQEMRVPEWLLSIVERCLEKKAEMRFADGQELYEAVTNGRVAERGDNLSSSVRLVELEKENETLRAVIQQFKEDEERMLANSIPEGNPAQANRSVISFSKPLFFISLILLIGLIAYLTNTAFFKGVQQDSDSRDFYAADSSQIDSAEAAEDKQPSQNEDEFDKTITSLIDSTLKTDTLGSGTSQPSENSDGETGQVVPADPEPEPETDPVSEVQRAPKYTLSASRAYFYENPDENSRRENFLSGNYRAELTALEDRNGFIYVVFFTTNGQVTKGWLRKRDLRRMGQ